MFLLNKSVMAHLAHYLDFRRAHAAEFFYQIYVSSSLIRRTVSVGKVSGRWRINRMVSLFSWTYTLPCGFISPLLCTLCMCMEINFKQSVRWKTDESNFQGKCFVSHPVHIISNITSNCIIDIKLECVSLVFL